MHTAHWAQQSAWAPNLVPLLLLTLPPKVVDQLCDSTPGGLKSARRQPVPQAFCILCLVLLKDCN